MNRWRKLIENTKENQKRIEKAELEIVNDRGMQYFYRLTVLYGLMLLCIGVLFGFAVGRNSELSDVLVVWTALAGTLFFAIAYMVLEIPISKRAKELREVIPP